MPISKTPYSCFGFKLNKLNGTPYLLLKDFGEDDVVPNSLRVFFNISFKEVFPQLPVIAIIFGEEFCRIISEIFVKKFKLFFTFI